VEEFILSAHVNAGGTVTFSTLLVHAASACQGRDIPCVIHHPGEHHMRGWELNWRDDLQLMERLCPHGLGHPDPDHLAYAMIAGAGWQGVHGCDGCCTQRKG
jgi:hypothetical protein